MLSERIKQTREQLGMTQSELHRKSGVSKGYISSLEAGHQKDPSYSKLSALAKALSTSPEYLFGDVDRQPDRTCETCMFFREFVIEDKGSGEGRCHRYPPSDNNIVESHDFCGEWQKR